MPTPASAACPMARRQLIGLERAVALADRDHAAIEGELQRPLGGFSALPEGRDAIWGHITASRNTIEQSRVLIVQIDEQINGVERELRLAWGPIAIGLAHLT
jgi:hypothetical protein